MPRYTTYGLTVESEIVLPELLAEVQGTGSSADCANADQDSVGRDGADRGITGRHCADRRCAVRLGRVPDARVGIHPTPLAWARAGDACLCYPGVATYHITDGRQILIEPAAGADERVVRLFLLGPALAVLLHQRGSLVLHASAVSIDGRAVAFAADKGEGKSTLAAALHARGHPLVADDVLAIAIGDADDALVYPGFPQLKLAPDSASQLTPDPHALSRVHPEYEKRIGPAARDFGAAAVPLHRVYVLQTAAPSRIAALPPQQQFIELVRHSYLAPMLRSTGESALHFKQVVALANRVPVAQLQRPRGMALLEEAARLIEDDARRGRW